MQSDEYDEGYFKETRDNVGLLLKTIRPMWWRWVRIIRNLDTTCGLVLKMETNSRKGCGDQRQVYMDCSNNIPCHRRRYES